jgi:hypothetical protein
MRESAGNEIRDGRAEGRGAEDAGGGRVLGGRAAGIDADDGRAAGIDSDERRTAGIDGGEGRDACGGGEGLLESPAPIPLSF